MDVYGFGKGFRWVTYTHAFKIGYRVDGGLVFCLAFERVDLHTLLLLIINVLVEQRLVVYDG